MRDSNETEATAPREPVTAVPAPVRRRPAPMDPIRRKTRRPLPDFTGLPVPREDADASFHEFLPAALQIVYTPPALSKRIAAYVVCGLIVAALLWSIFGVLHLFAIAPGEVQAKGGNQVIEPLESGQVSILPVKNGSHVDKGELVLQLDPTFAAAAKTIVEAKLANARAESIRNAAEAFAARAPAIDKDAPIAWTADIPADVRTREEAVLRADLAQLAATIADLEAKQKSEEASRDKYTANIAAQKTLIDSRIKRTAMHETLAKQGWDSRAMVLQSLEPLRQDQVSLTSYEGLLAQANATIPVIRDQMSSARETFIAEHVDAAATADRKTAELVEQLKKADLSLANLSLRAPVSGQVQSLAVTTVGQAIKVGDKLMQIVPDGAQLEVQAYVLNTDIGFVKVGQPVTIKVDTFPYTRYGTISGRVTHVGADAITGTMALAQQKDDATTPTSGAMSITDAAEETKDLVFPVTVALDKLTIRVEGRDVPLTAGMSVVAEIETQRQRGITYILYPLQRAFYK